MAAYTPVNPTEHDQVLLEAGQSYAPMADRSRTPGSWSTCLPVQDSTSRALLSPDESGDYTVRLSITGSSRSVEAYITNSFDFGGE